jgi:hypothetical protein
MTSKNSQPQKKARPDPLHCQLPEGCGAYTGNGIRTGTGNAMNRQEITETEEK